MQSSLNNTSEYKEIGQFYVTSGFQSSINDKVLANNESLSILSELSYF